MKYNEIMKELESMKNPKNVEGMSRFGINTSKAYGISMPFIRKLAKSIGRDHRLAGKLWAGGIHEARILAALVDDPSEVTASQMDKWVLDFNSWDVCDQVCANLFDKTEIAYDKAIEWSEREEEFVKRAGFALMAALAWHDKAATNKQLKQFLPIIKREACDERNFVKKAVNWALRQIGKRNLVLNKAAIKTAQSISKIDSKPARWIASDALRELTGEKVQQRLNAND